MGFFKDHPYDDRFTIDDPARDKKAGFRIEQFRFGELAVYFPPMQYLPYAACTGVEIVPASFHVTGGCGKSVPAYAVKCLVPCDRRLRQVRSGIRGEDEYRGRRTVRIPQNGKEGERGAGPGPHPGKAGNVKLIANTALMRKKKEQACACSFFSGVDGIRTHAPRRTNGFQDRLVMTASIPLQ